MLETLLTLAVAHVLAGFLLQTRWILDRKPKPDGFLLHIAIVGAAACLIAGTRDPRVLGVIILTHAAVHWAKLRWIASGATPEARKARDGLPVFLIDQLLHLAAVVAVAILYPSTVADGWWGGLPAEQQRFYFRVLCVVGGVVLAVSTGDGVIDKYLAGFGAHRDAVSPTPGQTPNPPNQSSQTSLGLPGGGQAIGCLERGMTLLFLLIGQPDGVGLLLAAKSILRFSDANARAHTEYVIIGTLLSFGWAIVSAILTRTALQHWS